MVDHARIEVRHVESAAARIGRVVHAHAVVDAITWQFNRADPDHDGTLDPKEAHRAGIKEKSAFAKANPDKDGTLDLGEYFDALAAQAR
ncbi:MAG: hypothetical protein JSR59_20435 [Proteobacteria bacterium]|nr:hypothetical protein [Pseudomonadota bacterium]